MNDVFAAISAAVDTVENNPILNISIFGAFVAVTLFMPDGIAGLVKRRLGRKHVETQA